jgi:hypothetical protein
MIYTPLPRRRRRPSLAPDRAGMRGVSALVIGTPPGSRPGELWRQGMAGMGDGLLDKLAGGTIATIQGQLSKVELALKISTAAAVASFLLSVFLATRRRSRA